MEKKVDINREEQFRSKIQKFYTECKETIGMPYLEGVFIETVLCFYTFLENNERPTMQAAENVVFGKVEEMYPKIKIEILRKEIRSVARGSKVGLGTCWQWSNFCAKYRHEFREETWRIDEEKIISKKIEIYKKYNRLSLIQKDIIILIATIQLLNLE